LELGGKNPVVIEQGADVPRYARRIARARLVNGGQACVCPDYVFVPEHALDDFVHSAAAEFRTMFPSILANQDFTSSINEANYQRVLGLLEDARAKGAHIASVVPPGEQLPDSSTRKIPPTLVTNVDADMRIAAEEIFGPVLVVMGYRLLEEAISYINARPSPLVAYWYGSEGPGFREFLRRTRTGGVARNDFALQMSLTETPFGGVGHSGTGAYHGKAGFDSFSHHRSVVGSDLPFSITSIASPPFSRPKALLGKLSVSSTRRRARRRIDAFESRFHTDEEVDPT
jgi:coniferyl-aldehyde dehydrogenase